MEGRNPARRMKKWKNGKMEYWNPPRRMDDWVIAICEFFLSENKTIRELAAKNKTQINFEC